MSVLIAVALAGIAAPSEPTPLTRCTAATRDTCAAGSWTGAFLGADWTLEIKRENGAWTGRYITTRGKSWHPLLDLQVVGGKVTFRIGSTPELTFRLALDPTTETLGGEVEGFRMMPFVAARTA